MVDAKNLSDCRAVGENRTPTIFRSPEPESRAAGPFSRGKPPETDCESFSETHFHPLLPHRQRRELTRKRNAGSALLAFWWKTHARADRRFHERVSRVQRELGIERDIAVRVVEDNDRRARQALRRETSPATLVREIRADLARTQGGAR